MEFVNSALIYLNNTPLLLFVDVVKRLIKIVISFVITEICFPHCIRTAHQFVFHSEENFFLIWKG